MKKYWKSLLASGFLVAVSNFSIAAVSREGETGSPDPARWYTEDATPQARYQTMKKEAAAAYQEALAACKTMQAAGRRECEKEARVNFNEEMAGARQALAVR